MKKQIPLAAVLGIGVLIVAAAGYVGLVKPKQTKVSDVSADIVTLETDLETAERQRAQQIAAATDAVAEESEIEVADLVRLSKAMPDEDDVAATLVELDSVSAAAGVEFVSIQPLAPVDAGPGYSRVPIQLTFSGSYFDLTSVLYDLRNLVRVRDGELSADGRLFTLDQLDLHESQSGFPEIEALLTVSAYTFGATGPTDAAGVPAAPQIPEAPAPAPANGDSDSTETDPGDEEAPTFEVDPSTPPALPDEDADEDEGEDT